MTSDLWEPYSASAEQPWNRQRVTHLHRRLGFGATPEELERDLESGPAVSIARFLAPANREIVSQTRRLAQQSIDQNQIRLLKAAWVMQMWHGEDPLTEQLCLMWHNHFATSFLKVRDCHAMWQQNQLFRSRSRGKFGELLSGVLIDRAMLAWLDAVTNRIGRPNENLARELLELFTLGFGNYSEDDVKEVARVLTGWRIDDSGVRFDPAEHDAGTTTILGTTTTHDLESLVKRLVNHPATATRLAWRLCDHFLGGRVSESAIEQLAEYLTHCELRIETALEKIVTSARFFSNDAIGHRVRSPVALVVSGIRESGLHRSTKLRPAVSPESAAGWMAAMGQDLFQPPGVAGWRGGTVWLATAAMIQRAAFAKSLGDGALTGWTGRNDAAYVLASASAQLD